jgi:steroid delta-isomerase-like uncharacterized protein
MKEIDRGLGTRWFEEVWNKLRREAIAEMLAPDCEIHDGELDTRGPEGFYPFFDRMCATLSDLRITVMDNIAEGNLLCVRWVCTAKHTGDGLGVPPTGRTINVTGITIVRVADGKVVEAWQNWDMLGMMEQIKGVGKSATYIGAS